MIQKFFYTIFLCAASHALHAQIPLAEPTGDTARSAIRQLREVTVTAEKRELPLTSIPAAMSVLTSRDLQHENSLDLRDLSGLVPNFYLQEGGLKLSTPMYVRGVGTVSGTPPVGLYVDGVPVFDKNAFIFDLYDIKQIEVSRGPQTTLYGRNSIIGMINITTNPPASRFSGQAKAGVGNHNTQHYHLLLHLPWYGAIYNKFAFAYNRTDGYFKNRYTGGNPNRSESYNARYQGLLHTDASWKVAMGVDYHHGFDDGYAYHALDSLHEHRYTVNYNSPSSYRRDLLSAHVNIRKQLAEIATLKSTSSYSWTKDKQELDADFTYHDVFQNLKKSRQHQFTQELNLQSVAGTGDAPLQVEWTVGAFAFHKDLRNDYLARFGTERQLLMPLNLDEAGYHNNTVTWGVAGYGQFAMQIPRLGLSLTVGLRYDREHVKLTYRDSLLFPGEARFTAYHDWQERQKFEAWLPKFTLLKKHRDFALSTYISVAKGYKAGGYNVVSNEMSSQLVQLDYDRESLWNYELGGKYFSNDNRFNVNAALFYIDWKDQQIFVMGTMGPNIKNAGDARSLGAELDLHWEFLPHTTFFAAAGYSDSEYYRHETADYEGNRVVMVPEFTLNTGIGYSHPLRGRCFHALTVNTNVTGFGKQYFDEANLLEQDPYFLWNADLALIGSRVEFHLWGKNILDKAYFSYQFTSPVGSNLPEYLHSGQSGAPTRFGASLTIKM